MSIALESSGNGIELSGFIGGISSRSSVFESSDSGWKVAGAVPDDRLTALAPSANLSEKATEESASCSSSIGRNSESSERCWESENGDEEMEVQSSYKGPLDTMDALEDSLPISRQGISKFYCGKSKSFTSLADATSSAKDLSKPENCFNRKRKNLLATNNFFNRNQNSLRHSWGGIPKKPANSSRTTLALGVAMSSSASYTSEESSEASRLPPLPPHGKSSVNALSPPRRSFTSRSFSLTDLHSTNTDPAIWPKLH